MATQAELETALTEALNKAAGNGGGDVYTKREVQQLLDTLAEVSGRLLKKGEDVRVRGLVTIKVRRMPARKARDGRNPATGEPMRFKAKPASKKLRALPLKPLKDKAGIK
jgi:DNA-binding protein HU-beta